MNDLMVFPTEIQEMILKQLNMPDLLNAAKVCKLWQSICERLSKKKYAKLIPKECIKEIKITVKTKDFWLNVISYHYIQQSLINNTFKSSNTVSVKISGIYHLCFCVYGPLVLIGCKSGDIEIYNLGKSKHPVEIIKLLDQPIIYMEVMEVKNVLLVKTDKKRLEILSPPYICDNSWVYKICHLKLISLDSLNDIICERNFCTYDSLLAVVTSLHQINVYRVGDRNKKKVYFKSIKKFVSEKTISTISIWDDEIIILCRSGEVLRWCYATEKCFMSDRYQEICYENPVWIFRNIIFCSSIISSQLLGYWHMNRGADYWLIGRPNRNLVRCWDLGRLFYDDNNLEYVLCVCLYQRLLACGTRTGKVLLYYLSDRYFSSEDLDDKENYYSKKEFNRVPDLIIETNETPIKSIQIRFGDSSVKIYLWPYYTPGSRSDLKEFFQCVLLK